MNGLPRNKPVAIQGIPKSTHIKRSDLLPAAKEKATFSFSNGNFSNLELRWYRGFPVAVRAYKTNTVHHEATVILSLPSNVCFPVLIGVCCAIKPYLLVTIFYGNVRKAVYMSLQGLFSCNEITLAQWVFILVHIAEGLLLMHSYGFVHGELKPENIIVMQHKTKCSKVWTPVFLNLDNAKALDRSTYSSVYKQDCIMFAALIDTIITTDCLKNSAHSSDLGKVSQVAREIFHDGNLAKVVTDLKKYIDTFS